MRRALAMIVGMAILPVAGLTAAAVSAGPGKPRQAPSTDVWLLEIRPSPNGFEVVGAPRNVSDRPGYDNQPAFTFDGAWLLYAAQRDEQTDIEGFDLGSGNHIRVTDTPDESEYSPTPIPRVGQFSVVRVEGDGTQRLWSFPFPMEMGGTIGTGPGSPLPPPAPLTRMDATVFLADIAPVGYHAWVGETIMLFVLGDPPTLQRANLFPGTGEVVAANIGRSLQWIPRSNALSFVDKSADPWTIRRYDLDSGEITALAPTFGDGEDLAWTPDGFMVMGSGSEIAVRRPGPSGNWHAVADLAEHGIAGITRIAVSLPGTHVAVVTEDR